MPDLWLALDPGVTTGYALAVKDGPLYVAYDQSVFEHKPLWRFLCQLDPAQVICERFDYRRGQSHADLYPCELIGVIHLWSKKPVYMQQPSVQSDKYAYWTDEKLREYEIYREGVEHGRSAVKHLLQWFCFGPGSKYGDLLPDGMQLVEEQWLRTTYPGGTLMNYPLPPEAFKKES